MSANIGKVGDDNFDSPSMIFGYDVIEPKSKTLKKTSFQDGSFHLIEVGVYFGANGAHFFREIKGSKMLSTWLFPSLSRQCRGRVSY